MKTNIFTIIIFVILLTSVTYAQSDSLYYLDPGKIVAENLFTKKIVMLGDYDHEQIGPFRNVYSTLENWLKIAASKNEATHLTYIVEKDSIVGNELNRYIRGGDLSSLVDKIAPDFYLEELEYYYNLRNFFLRIDSLNMGRANKITFQVKGFEEPDGIKFALMTKKENGLWSVNDRDSLLSRKIENYLDNNPDEQVLIFYGSAHLQTGFRNKNIVLKYNGFRVEETIGHYLAYYLKNIYKDVVTFNALYYDASISFSSFAESNNIPHSDFLTKTQNLDDPDGVLSASDYIWICHFNHLPIINGSLICSKKIFERTIEKINEAKSFLPGYYAQFQYDSYISSNMYMLTGNKFMSDTAFYLWLKDNKDFNITDWFYSPVYDSAVSPIHSLTNYLNMVFYPNGIVLTSDDSNMSYFFKWKNEQFPEIFKKVKFTNSIGIYWIGEPDEKIKAKKYLVEYSGQDYAEPIQYLLWYRKNILKIEF